MLCGTRPTKGLRTVLRETPSSFPMARIDSPRPSSYSALILCITTQSFTWSAPVASRRSRDGTGVGGDLAIPEGGSKLMAVSGSV